ncbi:MAG: GatB/YqeY domain-containing protein [Ardenticatenaceae bacterium]|nr:GatB/YqeY domain-containing protein [Ardenticatenaceae bacterium]
MGLRDQLNQDLKEAMRARDNAVRDTLRLILAAVKQADVDQQTTLDDEGVQTLLMKQAKQRQESITAYEEAGREDLAAPERQELLVIEKYLPKMMSRDEIMALATQIVAEVGGDGPRAMGAVMGKIMPQVKGKADGRLVNEVVRELLAA